MTDQHIAHISFTVTMDGKGRLSNVCIKHPPGTWKAALREVAAHYGMTVEELHERSNARRVSHPRQHAMTVLRNRNWSFVKIGRYFGVDHTTVMHGVKAYEARVS